MRSSSQRLQRLEEILAGTPPLGGSATGELEGASVLRIQQLTAELEAGKEQAADEIDQLATRLLLNEYAAAVARLRILSREAAARIDAAAEPAKDARRYLWRRDKLREAQRAALEDD